MNHRRRLPASRILLNICLKTGVALHEITFAKYCESGANVKLSRTAQCVMRKKVACPAAAIATWTFLTNHAHVLLCPAAEPQMRLRDVAARVGITERAVQRVASELEDAQYLQRKRIGRRNRYELHPNRHLRHSIEGHRRIGELTHFVIGGAGYSSYRGRRREVVKMSGSIRSSRPSAIVKM